MNQNLKRAACTATTVSLMLVSAACARPDPHRAEVRPIPENPRLHEATTIARERTIFANEAVDARHAAASGADRSVPEADPVDFAPDVIPANVTPWRENRSIRTRLIRREGKYPLIRVVENLERGPSGISIIGKEEMVADHLLVTVAPGNEAAFAAAVTATGCSMMPAIPGGGLLLVSFPYTAHAEFDRRMAELTGMPGVRIAEPDAVLEGSAIPNDPQLPQQWGLANVAAPGKDIRAKEAWSITTGSANVLVGIVDTGVDYRHPDLKANIWTNPGESGRDAQGLPKETNGKDDDQNGFIDDVHGWDFVNNDNDPMDDHSHGTQCAGIIGAVGNNSLGISGVAWKVSMVPLKHSGANGRGFTSTAYAALSYAYRINCQITSNSWGASGLGSSSLNALIASGAATGHVFVASAGNYQTDVDARPYWPASMDCPNIISVAATNPSDELITLANTRNWWGSSYGATTIDLSAPGISIATTARNSNYTSSFAGTSAAAPFVAGACALLRSVKPSLTAAQVKAAILNNVDPLPSLAGKTVSGGRLNLYKSLLAVTGETPINRAPVAAPVTVSVVEDTPQSFTLLGSDPDGDALTYEIISEPQRGTLSGSGATRTYLPALNDHGVLTCTYRVRDGGMTSQPALVTFNIASVNDRPICNDASFTVTPTGGTCTLVATDADGDPLTFSILAPPAHGRASIIGSTLRYQPDTGWVGSEALSIVASDGNLVSTAAKLVVTVVASAPSTLTPSQLGKGQNGSHAFDATTGSYTINGSGTGFNLLADNAFTLARDVTGDVTVTARIVSLGTSASIATAGIFVRSSTSANAQGHFCGLASDGKVRSRHRIIPANVTWPNDSAVVGFPRWVQIERRGNTMYARHSANGTTWNALASWSDVIPNALSVGLAVASGSATTLATATIDQVQIATVAVKQPSWPLRLSWQPQQAPTAVVEGSTWSTADGAVFGARSALGIAFGWSKGIATVYDRNVTTSPDQRYDTSITVAPENRWEIEVPAGRYLVTLCAGDATATAGTYAIAAEGVQVVAGTATAASRWITGSAETSVSDGRLTISSLPSATMTRLAWIHIEPLPIRPAGGG